MPQYSIKLFPNSSVKYKHILLKRDLTKTKEKKEREEWKENDKKIDENLSRAKTNITELALCNIFDYFCTFTFSDDKIDRNNLALCYKSLRKFFNNFQQRQAPDFKYLIIPEFHKDGSIHFHGLVSGIPESEFIIPPTIKKRLKDGTLADVPNTPKYKDWKRYSDRFGYFNCSRVKSSEKIAFYITKYITKDMSDIPKGVHLFAYSRGLKKAEIIHKSNQDIMLITPTYNGDFCKIAYDKYQGTYEWLDYYGEINPFMGEIPETMIKELQEEKENSPANRYDYASEQYMKESEVEYVQAEI